LSDIPPPEVDPAGPDAEAEAEALRERKLEKIRKRWSRRRVGAAGFVGVLLLLVLAGLAVRLGVLTDPGRAVVTRILEGSKVGRYGRLHVEGLSGDVFGAFSIRRLSIVDARGEWLQARDVSLRWVPHELVARRVHARSLRASVLQVMRRPVLSPPSPPGGGSAVSVILDDVRLRLETLPAFSTRVGVWDVAGQADIRRGGTASGRVDAQSRLHAGVGLAVLFRIGPKGRLLVRADAVEGEGGALAGSLGLPARERFFVHGRVDGNSSEAGTLSVVAESGRRRPLVANGRWSKAGATLDARVLLDASTLTAPYAARAGPEAQVSLRAAHVRGDLFQVEGSARARDASIAVKGPVDWRRRRTEGLSVQLAVAEFRRWVGELHAGPTRTDGVVTGTLSRWRYQARVEMSRLDQYGYRLARIAGPAVVSRERGEFRLRTEVTSAGGSGEGLLPALLGPSPKVKLDGSRLDGGRLLIRSLDVAGAGLQLTADGDRSLLGVLSLKGDLALSRLERAHAGAMGVVRANWTARQSGSRPWDVGFDARGEGFATGYPELDRLLGPAPRYSGEAAYGPGLTITRSQVVGEAAEAAVDGTVDPMATLALNLVWRARGPFGVGPIEIAGEANGVGKVTGRAAFPVFDIAADLASIDAGRLMIRPAHLSLQAATEGGVAGQVSVSGPSEWGPASARARFRLVGDGLDLADIAADVGGVKAAGALALRDGAPSSADLTLAVGPGAFLSQGRLDGTVRIVERAGGATARIALDGQNLAPPGSPAKLRTLRLRADGPWERLPFQVSADGVAPAPWRFAGDGLLSQAGAGAAIVREVSLTGAGRLRQADVRTSEPLRIRLGPDGTTVRLRADVGRGAAALDARQAGDALQAKGSVQGVELAAFFTDYVGRLSGDLTLDGRGGRLDGVANAALEGGRDRDAPADVALTGRMRATLADTRVRIEGSATNPQGLTSRLDLDLPAEATAAPFRIALVRNRPVSGSFEAQGELRPLWDLFGGGGQTLSGKGSVQATLAGTLAALRPTGQARLEGGRFQDAGTGLDLRDLTAQASFDEDSIEVRRFTGDDGRGGSLSGMGELAFGPNAASTLNLTLERFRLLDNELARATASGQATVTRDAAGKVRLQGALSVDRADITANPPVPSGVVPLDVIEVNKPGDEAETRSPGLSGPDIALDVRLRANRGLFIRGNGLDAELSLDAHVGGTVAAPDLAGVARVVRGDYEFAGKRFEFDETGVIRLGSRAELIRLNLTARREDPALTAVVRIEGTAARPEITLSSMPVLPQDEVLSQVLFGRSASQLSPLEAAQLASAVTALATGGGFDVLGGCASSPASTGWPSPGAGPPGRRWSRAAST
jgi:translocation and assembly module TamB